MDGSFFYVVEDGTQRADLWTTWTMPFLAAGLDCFPFVAEALGQDISDIFQVDGW